MSQSIAESEDRLANLKKEQLHLEAKIQKFREIQESLSSKTKNQNVHE